MTKLVIALIASAAFVTGAIAADMPRKEPPVPQPVGKMPGKYPVGKAPVGKYPVSVKG